jgi:hypothetical protein
VRPEGAGPQRGYTRPGTGSLHPVAIRAAAEATRLLKPLVQKVARRLGERAGRNVSERRAGPENSDAGADTPRFRGKAEADGIVRANKFHPTCRGSGDGMQAKGTMRNTGSPSGDRRMDQLATRERQAGPYGMAERLVVPMKPGNSGGGKGPQLKGNARSNEGPRDWR